MMKYPGQTLQESFLTNLKWSLPKAGDLCAVVAMGNAQAKPERTTHEVFKVAAVVLNSLGGDEASAKAAWRFWPDTYGRKT